MQDTVNYLYLRMVHRSDAAAECLRGIQGLGGAHTVTSIIV